MALTALNLTDPKYAWVIRPVEVEEVCVGGSSCMTREGGSYSGTFLRDHCCVFATREVLVLQEFQYISGRHGNAYWGHETMLSSLAVCVCRLERLIRASHHIQQHKLAEKVDKHLSNFSVCYTENGGVHILVRL